MPYSYFLPFAEALIPIWLLSGVRLRAGWIFTAFLIISLAFGLIVAKQNASDNYCYVIMACVGLYMSRYDTCQLPAKNKTSFYENIR